MKFQHTIVDAFDNAPVNDLTLKWSYNLQMSSARTFVPVNDLTLKWSYNANIGSIDICILVNDLNLK